MSDPFHLMSRGLESPADRHFAISPSDSADLNPVPRVLYCASAGTAVVRDRDGQDLSYSLTSGQILPLSARRILATGTTATLVGWL